MLAGSRAILVHRLSRSSVRWSYHGQAVLISLQVSSMSGLPVWKRVGSSGDEPRTPDKREASRPVLKGSKGPADLLKAEKAPAGARFKSVVSQGSVAQVVRAHA